MPTVDPFDDEDGSRSTTIELGTLQTISFSVFRDKQPVRNLGTVYESGRSRGPRTIGGTLIFTVFDEAVLARIMRVRKGDFDRASPTSDGSLRYAVMDQLPPFDVTISFMNCHAFTLEQNVFWAADRLAIQSSYSGIGTLCRTIEFLGRSLNARHHRVDRDQLVGSGCSPRVDHRVNRYHRITVEPVEHRERAPHRRVFRWRGVDELELEQESLDTRVGREQS